jgi:hypothetical protein
MFQVVDEQERLCCSFCREAFVSLDTAWLASPATGGEAVWGHRTCLDRDRNICLDSGRAECRSCGWLGMGSERIARHHETEPLFCPRCSGPTKSWVVDNYKEEQSLARENDALNRALWESNQRFQAARLASAQLHEKQRATERCRHRVAMLSQDDRSYLAARTALLAAQQEEAEAFSAAAEANAQAKAMGQSS